MPSREQLLQGTLDDLNVALGTLNPAELVRLTELIEQRDLSGIINRYPVRESGIRNAIVKALHFGSRDDYERAMLRRVEVDPILREQLRHRLGNLAGHLA